MIWKKEMVITQGEVDLTFAAAMIILTEGPEYVLFLRPPSDLLEKRDLIIISIITQQ